MWLFIAILIHIVDQSNRFSANKKLTGPRFAAPVECRVIGCRCQFQDFPSHQALSGTHSIPRIPIPSASCNFSLLYALRSKPCSSDDKRVSGKAPTPLRVVFYGMSLRTRIVATLLGLRGCWTRIIFQFNLFIPNTYNQLLSGFRECTTRRGHL